MTENDHSELLLQFEEQVPSNVSEIQQLSVHGSNLIVLTRGRNFFIYDMVLKLPFRTNLRENCREFDMMSVLSENEEHLVIAAHSAGESQLTICTIEKQKA